LQQSVRPRIRVIDDSSEDSTTEIVENIIKGQKQASLLRARPLPVGWRGKVHALSIGIQEVKSPWILSTDADTWHHPELLARAQETIETVNLDSLSIAGFQEAVGLGENMMIPPVFSLLDGLLGDWRDAAKGDSDIANGQFILVRRKALESIGGFASIRNEALDDVALIERLRSRNFRHSFFRAQDLLRIRMYHGLREAFHGWRRIFGSFLASQHVVFIYVLSILLLPPTVILVSLLARDWLSALVVWLGGAFSSGINRASSKHSPFYAFLYPFDSLLLAACLIASWIDARMGRLASWKGRSIVLEEQ
jgi:glycosyltransferase involved in cell wall biosynthesis